MDTRKEHDTEICLDRPEVYQPPMLDKVGEFTALTRSATEGLMPEEFGYYSE